MKEIKSWKRSCPLYIVLLCPVNLLFQIFLLLKKLSRFMKKFYFQRTKISWFLFYYFRRQELSQKWAKVTKIAKVSPRESFCPKVNIWLTKRFLSARYFKKINLLRYLPRLNVYLTFLKIRSRWVLQMISCWKIRCSSTSTSVDG